MLKPTEVKRLKSVHNSLAKGVSVEDTATALKLSVEDVEKAFSSKTLARYRRYLKAKSRGLSSTAGL